MSQFIKFKRSNGQADVLINLDKILYSEPINWTSGQVTRIVLHGDVMLYVDLPFDEFLSSVRNSSPYKRHIDSPAMVLDDLVCEDEEI